MYCCYTSNSSCSYLLYFFGLRLEGLAPWDPPVTYRIGFCGTEVAITIINGLISSTRQSIVFLQTAAALLFHRSVLRLNTFECGIKLIHNTEGSPAIPLKQVDIQQESIFTISEPLLPHKSFTITGENDNTVTSEGIFVFITKRYLALCDPSVRHFPEKSWRWLSCYSRPSWRNFLFGVSSVLEAKVSVTPACSWSWERTLISATAKSINHVDLSCCKTTSPLSVLTAVFFIDVTNCFRKLKNSFPDF